MGIFNTEWKWTQNGKNVLWGKNRVSKSLKFSQWKMVVDRWVDGTQNWFKGQFSADEKSLATQCNFLSSKWVVLKEQALGNRHWPNHVSG